MIRLPRTCMMVFETKDGKYYNIRSSWAAVGCWPLANIYIFGKLDKQEEWLKLLLPYEVPIHFL